MNEYQNEVRGLGAVSCVAMPGPPRRGDAVLVPLPEEQESASIKRVRTGWGGSSGSTPSFSRGSQSS